MALSFLTACSTMFKTEEEVEADRIALEISRAQVPGSSGAAFSPVGNLVAIGTRDMIWVADTTTGERVARLGYEKASRFGGRKSLHFIDDHRLLAAGDGAVYLWDLREGLITHRLKLANSLQSPRAIAWSGAARTLAISSASTEQPVTLVRVGDDGFAVPRPFPGFDTAPADLLFSRDGQYLAATRDEQGVVIKNVQSGEAAGELPTRGFADNLELFGDNELLVSGADIALWTFLQQEEAFPLENPDLKGQVDRQVAARVAETLAITSVFAVGVVVCMAGAALGAIGGGDSLGCGDVFLLPGAAYDAATDQVETSPQAWCGRSTSVSPDGNLLVDVYPGITSEVIRIFDLRSGELVKTLNPPGEYHCVARFSPDSRQLLLTSSKAAILYATDTWQRRDIRLEFR